MTHGKFQIERMSGLERRSQNPHSGSAAKFASLRFLKTHRKFSLFGMWAFFMAAVLVLTPDARSADGTAPQDTSSGHSLTPPGQKLEQQSPTSSGAGKSPGDGASGKSENALHATVDNHGKQPVVAKPEPRANPTNQVAENHQPSSKHGESSLERLKPREPERLFPENPKDNVTTTNELERALAEVLNPENRDTPTTTNLLPMKVEQKVSDDVTRIQQMLVRLELARRQRRERASEQAASNLIDLLKDKAPVEIQRAALFELALVALDEHKHARALQVFAQFINLYPSDPLTIEILLRQGLIYREIGSYNMAVAKFHSVMTSALNLKLDRLEYYQRMVLQAQTEIAETYYTQGKYDDAADFFKRLLKQDARDLNKMILQSKLIRCLSVLARQGETIGQAKSFLDRYPKTAEAAEVRFILASTYKSQGHNQDALKQVLLLMESSQETSGSNPVEWAFWQKRAGNEIANELYSEGDYVSTLDIYLHLIELDKSAAWRIPVWYQIGLVFERLQQPARARDVYQNILNGRKELTATVTTPSLLAVIEMAQWRQDHLVWLEKTLASQQILIHGLKPAEVR
ncbi:MAG: tetratricopeptide repeat protein [Pedosphaera sp.]|nr:tetratricopeptide repeat protein [Pedosphaera sp.]